MIAGPRRHGIVALACALFIAHDAAGQRVLVITQARTTTGDGASLSAHIVDCDRGIVLPDVLRLPGFAQTRPVQITAKGVEALVSFEFASRPGSHDRRYGIAWLDIWPALRPRYDTNVAPPGVEMSSAGSYERSNRAAQLTFVQRTSTGGGIYTLPRDSPEGQGRERAAFSGELIDFDRSGDRLAVLLRDPQNGVLRIDLFHAFSGREMGMAEIGDAETDTFGERPAWIRFTPDGSMLLVATSDHVIEESESRSATRIRAFEAETLEAATGPITVRGETRPATVVADAGVQHIWIGSQEPGTDFARVALFDVRAEIAEQLFDIPFTEVYGPPRVAVDAGHDRAWIGVNRRLVRVSGHGEITEETTFDDAISTLSVADTGVLVGEGNRIHRLDSESLERSDTFSFDSGFVIDAALTRAPARTDGDGDGSPAIAEGLKRTSDQSIDSDGDGQSDGVDPLPGRPSPHLSVPPLVSFSGAAVGNEFRSILIAPEHTGETRARVELSGLDLPFNAYPKAVARFPSITSILVDPSAYTVGESAYAYSRIDVTISMTDDGGSAITASRRVVLEVLPDVASTRRILWLSGDGTDGGDSLYNRIESVRFVLASPPHFFSHEMTGVPPDPLDSRYSAVVLALSSAARALPTRRSLFEYVAQGGAMLLVCDSAPGEYEEVVNQWLRPLGVTVRSEARLRGEFDIRPDSPFFRVRNRLPMRDAMAVTIDDDRFVMAGNGRGPNGAVFAALTYGVGRVAVLASDAPLSEQASRRGDGHDFAAELFEWLTRARQEIHDVDGDGLSDEIEDRNGNGAIDPGESHSLLGDTDGDGVSDGQEDSNVNGRVDEGETSVLNPDTDGDGLWDGADPVPVEAGQELRIERLALPGGRDGEAAPIVTGPAEGGTRVEVYGAGFSPKMEVWFGDRRSPRARMAYPTQLNVDTPACSNIDGGPVSVMVRDPDTQRSATLAYGFQYGPKTLVELTLRALERSAAQYGLYEGTIAIEVDSRGAELSSLDILLNLPDVDRETLSVRPGPWAVDDERIVSMGPLREGWRLTMSAGRGAAAAGSIAALVDWRLPADVGLKSFETKVDSAAVRARNNELLRTTFRPVTIALTSQPVLIRRGRTP